MNKIPSIAAFRHPRLSVWLKACAIMMTVSFVLPYVTWAFDAGNYAICQPNFMRIAHLGKALTIPEKIGAISRGFQGNGKTIVCIQDLHCNYEVQKNIANIIQHLVKKNGLKLIGEEGAFDTVNTDKISTFPIKKIREQVSDYFVKQGKITGAEYYVCTSGQDIRLVGIETPELYKAGQQAVRAFLNAESQGYCYDLRDMLEELKADIYNSRLLKFDGKRVAYREGNIDILKYSAYLHHTARKLQVDLSVYPNLARFLSLKQNVFLPEVDPDQLFQELDKLDANIRGYLYSNNTQQELDELYTRLDIIERLLNISVSPEELDKFRTEREKYTIQAFINFVGAIRESPTNEVDYIESDMYALDEYLNKVEEFYRLADERSIHFVDNLVRKMDCLDENLAVMINGGFHTDKVLAELKRRDITHVSIKPRVTRHDVVNPYFFLLQDRKTPLEKLLAKNQTIMSLPTSWGIKAFLLRTEFTLKCLLTLAPESLQKKALTYLDENNLVKVISLSPLELAKLRVEIPKGVELLATSLKSKNKPVYVLLAREGMIKESFLRKITLLPTVVIAGTRLSVLEPDQAVKAMQNISRGRPVEFVTKIFYLPGQAWDRANIRIIAAIPVMRAVGGKIKDEFSRVFSNQRIRNRLVFDPITEKILFSLPGGQMMAYGFTTGHFNTMIAGMLWVSVAFMVLHLMAKWYGKSKILGFKRAFSLKEMRKDLNEYSELLVWGMIFAVPFALLPFCQALPLSLVLHALIKNYTIEMGWQRERVYASLHEAREKGSKEGVNTILDEILALMKNPYAFEFVEKHTKISNELNKTNGKNISEKAKLGKHALDLMFLIFINTRLNTVDEAYEQFLLRCQGLNILDKAPDKKRFIEAAQKLVEKRRQVIAEWREEFEESRPPFRKKFSQLELIVELGDKWKKIILSVLAPEDDNRRKKLSEKLENELEYAKKEMNAIERLLQTMQGNLVEGKLNEVFYSIRQYEDLVEIVMESKTSLEVLGVNPEVSYEKVKPDKSKDLAIKEMMFKVVQEAYKDNKKGSVKESGGEAKFSESLFTTFEQWHKRMTENAEKEQVFSNKEKFEGIIIVSWANEIIRIFKENGGELKPKTEKCTIENLMSTSTREETIDWLVNELNKIKSKEFSSGGKSKQFIHKRDLEDVAILALAGLAVGIWQTASSGFGLLPIFLIGFSSFNLFTVIAKWRGLPQGQESTTVAEELESQVLSLRAHGLAHESIDKLGAVFGIQNLGDYEWPVHLLDFLFYWKAYWQIKRDYKTVHLTATGIEFGQVLTWILNIPAGVDIKSPQAWADAAIGIALAIFIVSVNLQGILITVLLILTRMRMDLRHMQLAGVPRVARQWILEIGKKTKLALLNEGQPGTEDPAKETVADEKNAGQILTDIYNLLINPEIDKRAEKCEELNGKLNKIQKHDDLVKAEFGIAVLELITNLYKEPKEKTVVEVYEKYLSRCRELDVINKYNDAAIFNDEVKNLVKHTQKIAAWRAEFHNENPNFEAEFSRLKELIPMAKGTILVIDYLSRAPDEKYNNLIHDVSVKKMKEQAEKVIAEIKEIERLLQTMQGDSAVENLETAFDLAELYKKKAKEVGSKIREADEKQAEKIRKLKTNMAAALVVMVKEYNKSLTKFIPDLDEVLGDAIYGFKDKEILQCFDSIESGVVTINLPEEKYIKFKLSENEAGEEIATIVSMYDGKRREAVLQKDSYEIYPAIARVAKIIEEAGKESTETREKAPKTFPAGKSGAIKSLTLRLFGGFGLDSQTYDKFRPEIETAWAVALGIGTIWLLTFVIHSTPLIQYLAGNNLIDNVFTHRFYNWFLLNTPESTMAAILIWFPVFHIGKSTPRADKVVALVISVATAVVWIGVFPSAWHPLYIILVFDGLHRLADYILKWLAQKNIKTPGGVISKASQAPAAESPVTHVNKNTFILPDDLFNKVFINFTMRPDLEAAVHIPLKRKKALMNMVKENIRDLTGLSKKEKKEIIGLVKPGMIFIRVRVAKTEEIFRVWFTERFRLAYQRLLKDDPHKAEILEEIFKRYSKRFQDYYGYKVSDKFWAEIAVMHMFDDKDLDSLLFTEKNIKVKEIYTHLVEQAKPSNEEMELIKQLHKLLEREAVLKKRNKLTTADLSPVEYGTGYPVKPARSDENDKQKIAAWKKQFYKNNPYFEEELSKLKEGISLLEEKINILDDKNDSILRKLIQDATLQNLKNSMKKNKNAVNEIERSLKKKQGDPAKEKLKTAYNSIDLLMEEVKGLYFGLSEAYLMEMKKETSLKTNMALALAEVVAEYNKTLTNTMFKSCGKLIDFTKNLTNDEIFQCFVFNRAGVATINLAEEKYIQFKVSKDDAGERKVTIVSNIEGEYNEAFLEKEDYIVYKVIARLADIIEDYKKQTETRDKDIDEKSAARGGKSALLKMWTFMLFPDLAQHTYIKYRVLIETGWVFFLGGVVVTGLWGLSMLGMPLLADWFPIDTIIGQMQSTFEIALIFFPILHLDKVSNWILDRAPPGLNRFLSPALRTDTPTPMKNAIIAAGISATAYILMHYLPPMMFVYVFVAGIFSFHVLHVEINAWFDKKNMKTPKGLINKAKYEIRNKEYYKAMQFANRALLLIKKNPELAPEQIKQEIANIQLKILRRLGISVFYPNSNSLSLVKVGIESESDSVVSGSIIDGRYELREKISGSEGGYGDLFKAYDKTTNKIVAIRVSKPEEDYASILSECILLILLFGVPNIPKPGFAGYFKIENQEHSFYVMDLVEGDTLEKFLKKHPTTEKEVIRIASKIFKVLDDIHALGFAHTSINSKNIVISSTGEPAIINFSKPKPQLIKKDEAERKKDLDDVIALIREMMEKIPKKSAHYDGIMNELDKLKGASIEETRAAFGRIMLSVKLDNLPAAKEEEASKYGESIDKRNSSYDKVPLLRRGVILLLGLWLFTLPSIGAANNLLPVEKINNCSQMKEFKRSHGMTSLAAKMKDNPANITLKEVGRLEFIVRVVFSVFQNENEFYATRHMLRLLELDTLNKEEKGMSIRSSLAKQLLILSLEHQSKMYERTIKWQVKYLPKWMNPLNKVSLYKEEEAETIDTSERVGYADYYKNKTYRDLTPTDLGRLFEELTTDINIAQPDAEPITARLTDKKEVFKLLENEDFIARKDGNEKWLAAMEEVDKTLWQVLLKEFRGKCGEDLVAAGIIEHSLKSGLMEVNEKPKEKDKRDMETAAKTSIGVQEMYAVTAPNAVEFMNEVFKNIDIQANEELKERVDNFKALLKALGKTQGEVGQIAGLKLDAKIMRAVAAELDHLHAKDKEPAVVAIGTEDKETVYAVCDAKSKKIILKTAAGMEYDVLAPNIGEVIGKKSSKDKIIEQAQNSSLKWFGFKGREVKMADEIEPNIIDKIAFKVIMFLVQGLPARVKNIIMPLVLKDKALQIANINRAAALAERDLEEKDGFGQAKINIDKIALAKEFSQPNSYLRQQYRRMAQNPGELKLQANFARSIVRFMTKYEEIHRKEKQAESKGWTAIDRNRMIIMYATRLAENLNSIPIIENLAQPDIGHKVLKNKEDNTETKILGNVSVPAIIFPKALNKKQKGALEMRGPAGTLTDYLKRNYFIIDDNIREKHFKRMFKLRRGAMA